MDRYRISYGTDLDYRSDKDLMFPSRSWLSKATASRYNLLPDHTHERPRWRTPSSMVASIIPPPIVQSSYATSPKTVAKSIVLKQPSPATDRQSELEADLQFLLDAQAEGLVHGLEGGEQDANTSTGSTTPTAQSVRSAPGRRRARPARKKPGLRAARRGIYNSILGLSAVKDEELTNIDAEISQKDGVLARIAEWEQRQKGLQEAIGQVDDGEETVRAQRLRQESDVLQEEINAVELQLADLKARQRKLLRQAAAAENAVQARMASYTSALMELEADVQKFLSLEPSASERRPPHGELHASLWDLPAKRRTLDMARQQWHAEKEEAVQHRRHIEHEQTALREGAAVWKEVVEKVTEFEKQLRAGTADLSSSQSAWEDDPPPPASNTERSKQLLAQLGEVIEHLENSLNVAEEKEWKLLIAAIGAELDAMRQGKQILENVLKQDEAGPFLVGESVNGPDELKSGESAEDGDAIHELDRSFETARRPRRPSDSEDDPDPELLFSRQEIDGE